MYEGVFHLVLMLVQLASSPSNAHVFQLYSNCIPIVIALESMVYLGIELNSMLFPLEYSLEYSLEFVILVSQMLIFDGFQLEFKQQKLLLKYVWLEQELAPKK